MAPWSAVGLSEKCEVSVRETQLCRIACKREGEQRNFQVVLIWIRVEMGLVF